MANKKRITTILTAVLAAFVAIAATVFFSACSEKNSGEEADIGVYYYDYDENTEYTLTIENNYGVKLNFGKEKSGSYTLKGKDLRITVGKEVLSAEYADGKITLTENGNRMIFLKKITYTVKFEVSGGSAVGNQSIVNGRKIVKPEDPVKAGYNFVDWYSDSACSENALYDFAASVTGDLTLYAKWEYIPVVNTITYDNTSCTTRNETFTVTEGMPYTLEVPSVENGYTFVGWYTKAEGGERLTDENGASLEVWNKRFGDITVYAHVETAFDYVENEDGTGYEVSASAAVAKFETLTVPAYHNDKPVTAVLDFSAAAELKTINLPASIMTVEPSAFSNLKKLEAIEVYEVENLTANFKSIDGVLFSADGHTLVKYPLAKDGESYIIPAAVTVIADQAFADIRETGNYYEYSFYGKLTEVTLPSNLKTIGDQAFFRRGNLKVVKFNDDKSNIDWTIGDSAFSDMYLQKFPFNDTLVSIGDSAFYYSWTYLISVSFEGNVTFSSRLKKIGDSAFENCTWLGSITIPASCEYLGSAAFSGTRLDEVTIEQDSKLTEISDDAFNGCSFEEIYIPSGVTRIGNSAFEGCDYLTAITIPSGVTYIGSSAFEDCTEITELVLPSGLKTIGDSAFASMENLTSINIPNTVTSFGDGVFTGCDSLELDNVAIEEGNAVISIEDGVMYSADKKNLLYYPANKTSSVYVMPDELENIPDGIFRNNAYLTSITLSASLTKIPNGAFYKTKIQTITIPASVTTIEAEAFRSSAITELIFENGSNLTTIREYAFANTAIRMVTLPEKLEKLESSVFDGCSVLNGVTFTGNGLKTIPSGTFNGNIALRNITFSDGITEISSGAFKGCSSISEIVLPKNLITLSSDAFDGANRIQKISISEENATFKSVDRSLYSKDGKTLILYAGVISADADEVYVAPQGVEKIAERAFYGRSTLVSADLSGVKYIGARAFASCSALENVNLSNAEEIADYAFSGCSSLLKADISSVNTLGVGVFNSCTSLENVVYGKLDYVPDATFSSCSSLKSFDFANITAIGVNAFSGAGLTSVVLDDKLTELGDGAFASTDIKEIVIPSGVTVLSGVFSRCHNLVSVTLNNVTELSCSTFYECTSLTDVDASKVVTIGSSVFNACSKLAFVKLGCVTEIGDYAFYNCSSLLSITFPATLTNVGKNAFSGANKLFEVINLSGIEIRKGGSEAGGVAANALSVKTSGDSDIRDENGYKFLTVGGVDYLIAYVGSQTEVTLPASYNGKNYIVYTNAFKGSDFTSVTINGGIDEIKSGAFSNSYQLRSVNISGIIVTGENMFSGCSKLTDVTIGSGVETVANGTFSGCTSLYNVTLGGDLKEIADGAFTNCIHLRSITIPAGVETVNATAFDGCRTLVEIINLSSVNLDGRALSVKTSGETDLVGVNGFIFFTAEDKNYLVGYEGTDKDIVLPESYNGGNYEVYKYAFYYATLGSVTVNGGVTSFGEMSFYGSSMTSLVIGNNVNAVIGSKAFYFNTSLETVIIGNGITSIGEGAFSNSTKIKTLVIGNGVTEIGNEAFAYCNKLSDVTFGEKVEKIGNKAFYYTSLKNVVLPASLKTIATNAFDQCSSLNSITVNSQETLDIVLSSLNTFMKNAKIIKVKDGLEVNDAKFNAVGAEKIATESGYMIYSK